MDLSNHEWCMFYDLIYRNNYLYFNLDSVPIFYRNVEKAAFDGDLIAIKYLICKNEKEREIFKQSLFKYLEIPVQEEIYMLKELLK